MESVTKLIMAFITLIIGIMFLTQVSIQGSAVTSTIKVINETFSIASARNNTDGTLYSNSSPTLFPGHYATNWRTSYTECLPGSSGNGFEVRNQSENVLTGGGTDYTVNSDGSFTFINNARTNSTTGINANKTHLYYSYCGDDYLTQGWQRNTINIIPGFLAIALLLVSVGLFYSVYLDWK